MKDVGKKIFILVISIIIVVGAVLYFLKTIIEPPTQPEMTIIQHQQIIDAEIDEFSSSKGMPFNDSLYDALINKVYVFNNNDFLSDEQADIDKNRIINAYIPIFRSKCLKDFRMVGWGDSLFESISNRISALRSVKLSDKTCVVQGVRASDLQSIEKIMTDYEKAKRVSKIRDYYSVKKAERDIQDAQKYLDSEYIGVSNLKDGLQQVKPSIAQSHYNYVVNQVQKLRDYRYMDEKKFNSLTETINNVIQEYNKNKDDMYGRHARDINELNSTAGDITREALKYYKKLKAPEITVNLGGWRLWDNSTYHGYNIYASSSNYHTNNSESTMSITIKGYETFNLQVRCSSETNYDYLLVGYLNSYVDENHYKWRSKGLDSSWRTITYTGLDKSLSYKIQLVYKKDGSNYDKDDRAYVIIPKNN